MCLRYPVRNSADPGVQLVLDKVLLFGGARMQVKIISREYDAINRLLAEKIDCGTSLLHMETGVSAPGAESGARRHLQPGPAAVNQLVLGVDPGVHHRQPDKRGAGQRVYAQQGLPGRGGRGAAAEVERGERTGEAGAAAETGTQGNK